MALHLKLRPQTLTNLRRLSSSSTPQPPLAPPESGENDGAAPQLPPSSSYFSDIKERLRYPPSPSRRIPATPPPPPPLSSSAAAKPASGGNDGAAPQPPPFSSYFSDIKERLRSPPTPPRRIPDTPPPPPPLASSSAVTKPASLEEIRSNLAEFRLRSVSPPPPLASSSTLSFEELVKIKVIGKSGGDPADRYSLDSIRESLRQFRGPRSKEDQTPRSPSFSLKGFQEKLRSKELDTSILGKLPDSVFGRETREKKGEGEQKQMKTEFLKMYSYDELGAKLRKLRPEIAAKGGNEWFSLRELNERLAKLRELEEKETELMMAGVSLNDLRNTLVRLKEVEENKKASMQRLSILTNFSGQATPAFMLEPPQEKLLEKYFHPDHMSSAEKMKLKLKEVRDEFKMSESDCGSARVQVAQLTTKIKHLSTALDKKDKHSRKGLQEMVQRRKKLLKYLRRTDWDSYCLVLSRLGLRDVPEYKTPDYKIKSQSTTTNQKKKKKGQSTRPQIVKARVSI